MKKLYAVLSDKKLYWLWTALTAALFFYGSYALWYTFLAWEDIPLVVLNALLQAVTAGVMALLLVTAVKKTVEKKKQILTFFVAAVGYEAVQWIILAIVNKDGLFNRKAIYTAYNIGMPVFSAAVVITLLFAAKSGFRWFQRLLAIACAGFFTFLVFETGFRNATLEWTYKIYRAAKPYAGEIEDTGVYAGFVSSAHKIQPTDNVDPHYLPEIFLAKNEREGIQLTLASDTDGQSVEISVTDLTNEKGDKMPVRMYAERYTSVPGYGSMMSNEYTDALVPCDGTEQTLDKNRIGAYYIETVSDPDQPAGDYTATVTVKAMGKSKDYTLKATVWDFALPAAPACESAMGLASSEFFKLNGLGESSYGWNGAGDGETDTEQEAVYKLYYDYLLSHRISPYTLPYDILDERADAYMSDPGVTTFTVPYTSDDELLVKYYEKISSDPVWASKAYFYPIDEPCDEEAYATYTEMTDRLARLCPGYNMVTPFCTTEVEIGGETHSSPELQSGRSSILCGCSNIVMSDNILEEMNASREKVGSRLWWYVCCGPADEYGAFGKDTLWNNMFIYLDSLRHRELFWQQKQNGITGFLYWDSVYCDKGNPWLTSKTWDDYRAAGDGCLIYPGGYMNIDEPVGTVRLKNVCDGVEDYDYLTLAEERFGAEWVNTRLSLISTDINRFNTDPSVLESVRNEIGAALGGGN